MCQAALILLLPRYHNVPVVDPCPAPTPRKQSSTTSNSALLSGCCCAGAGTLARILPYVAYELLIATNRGTRSLARRLATLAFVLPTLDLVFAAIPAFDGEAESGATDADI